jgi:serine/threonine-protein kinase
MSNPTPEFLLLQSAVAGRYSLDREIGRGGMGVVFLARDVALDRPVALKLLPPALAAEAEVRRRFLREARTAAGLSHPHIVPIHAVEERDDLVFFVMAFVDGETLGSRVRRLGPLPAHEMMRITQEVAWALEHAHQRGVVHRDIKPDNILLERESGRAMVMDFGIAQVVETADTPRSGAIRGTPQYMSPEQVMGGDVQARSDLYSLGVTVFFAVTGRLPFESNSVAGFLSKHAEAPAPSLALHAPRLPPRFAALIDQCLQKDPSVRPDSAEALAHAVGAIRGAVVKVPVPLTRFQQEAHIVGGDLASYAGGVLASTVLFETLRAIEGDWFGILVGLEMVFITVFLGLGVARASQLVTQARDLLKTGYGHRALRAAIELSEREAALEEAERPSTVTGPWVTVGVGVGITALGVATGVVLENDIGVVIGMASAIGAPMITIRRLWSRIGAPKWWRKLLKGRVGKLAFRLGGVGLAGSADALPAAGERTEMALGDAADELFGALPKEQRERIGNVPAVVARLEADALALRERMDDPGVAERFATVVAALETLRMDLLRLTAGAASPDELTQDLEAARRVGAEIDAEVAGVREVQEILHHPTPPTD